MVKNYAPTLLNIAISVYVFGINWWFAATKDAPIRLEKHPIIAVGLAVFLLILVLTENWAIQKRVEHENYLCSASANDSSTTPYLAYRMLLVPLFRALFRGYLLFGSVLMLNEVFRWRIDEKHIILAGMILALGKELWIYYRIPNMSAKHCNAMQEVASQFISISILSILMAVFRHEFYTPMLKNESSWIARIGMGIFLFLLIVIPNRWIELVIGWQRQQTRTEQLLFICSLVLMFFQMVRIM